MSSECLIAKHSDKLSDKSSTLYPIAIPTKSDKIADMARELDPFRVLVGMRLEIVRSHLRFSKQQMADALGVKHSRYSSWEKGKNGLPIKFGNILEADFHINSRWLYSPDRSKLKLELVGRQA